MAIGSLKWNYNIHEMPLNDVFILRVIKQLKISEVKPLK